MKYFVGVEGGSTASTLVLLNEEGTLLSKIQGPSTNYLLVGETECFERLSCMLENAKKAADIPMEQPVDSLGLCLSGCVTEEDGRQFVEKFTKFNPDASRHCVAANDLVGSVYTSNKEAGVVIISGTGSNSLLFESNRTECEKGSIVSTCGGWGHLFGDEGSAYWIAKQAYKTLLDDNDNYRVSEHDTKLLRQVICQHFQLKDERSVGCFYQENDKKRFASLSKELYNSTKIANDAAINEIFTEAGRLLARKVVALIPRMVKSTLDSGLNIICVGSVFNSWDLLELGFVEILSKHLRSFRLLKLKQSSAFGAAKYAAKEGANFNLSIGETTDLLFTYSATSTGYLANGHHVSMNGNRTNGIHRSANENGNGNGPINGVHYHHHHHQVADEQNPEASRRSFNNCSVI